MTKEGTSNKRTYVVLRERELRGVAVEGDDPQDHKTETVKAWVFVENVEAIRDQQAIRLVSEKHDQGGTYVAIPARNFDPQPVKMERTPRAKIGKPA